MAKRLIDADKLKKKKKYSFQTEGLPFPKNEYFIKFADLLAAPTVDAVEVVRCRDCKHWNYGDCYRLELSLPDDFCSYGERNEG